MDLIIKSDTFDINCITIKNGKNSKKIIYDLGEIYLIVLSFQIDGFNIVNQTKKYIYIDITESPQNKILSMIDNHFKNNNKPYKHFINGNIIEVKKHKIYTIKKNDNLFISINNIKTRGTFTKVQLFTI